MRTAALLCFLSVIADCLGAQQNAAVKVKGDEIGGVVSSGKGIVG